MNERGIDFELQGRVRKYLEYIMHKDANSAKEKETLNKLTNALKRELMLSYNGKHLLEIPLFNDNFSKNTIEELSLNIKTVQFSPEEYIFQVI
jgi:hypothetical protein